MDKTEDTSPVAILKHNDQALNPHKAGSSKLCHMLTASDSGEKRGKEQLSWLTPLASSQQGKCGTLRHMKTNAQQFL